MYRGFKISELDFNNISYWNEIGLNLYENDKVQVKKNLDSYISANGILDGAKMESDWFPQVEAHVFISHSHGDEDIAIALAGWLFEKFNIKAFIDSCIWGYADNLLKSIDVAHCKNPNKPNSFDYTLRNYSTSHVHMMLSTALSKMIDKAECLFFLKTPKSIMVSEIKTKTLSPWIYSEIAISKIIQKKVPARLEKPIEPKVKSYSKGGKFMGLQLERVEISHELDLNHFADLDLNTLLELDKLHYDNPELALNKIYELIPAPEKNKIL